MGFYWLGVFVAFILAMYTIIINKDEDRYREHSDMTLAIVVMMLSFFSWAFIGLVVLMAVIGKYRTNDNTQTKE